MISARWRRSHRRERGRACVRRKEKYQQYAVCTVHKIYRRVLHAHCTYVYRNKCWRAFTRTIMLQVWPAISDKLNYEGMCARVCARAIGACTYQLFAAVNIDTSWLKFSGSNKMSYNLFLSSFSKRVLDYNLILYYIICLSYRFLQSFQLFYWANVT